jgi:eukaryotic-like serine/threonine-protein kinase
MIQPGKVLQHRYRIDKQIGQGGMGAVYVATDERFGSVVAIKETLCMDDNYRKAIEREARLLNSLKHIALPRVTDHFLEENGQFLVMEYISGDDLAQTLETSSRPFPVEQVLTWADQLLEALDFLHGQVSPVIHRDIKPQNLKVTPKGQIVLLDFGLAKGNVTDAGHQTAAKSIFGYSRNYASLEQIQGTGTDPRSDLYSLAATLYHLLTNRPPEDALTRAMAVLSHQPDPLVPANHIVPDIPAGVAAVLHSALALNAAQRPASAGEMRSMLRDHENYTELIAAVPTAAVLPAGEIHSQRTRILPGSTIHDGGRLTDVKTELLPNQPQLSQVTSVRLTPENTESGSRSRFGFVSGVLATIVLACAGLGAVYVYNGGFSEPDAEQPSMVVPEVAVEPPMNTAATEISQDATNTNRNVSVPGAASSTASTAPATARPQDNQTAATRAQAAANAAANVAAQAAAGNVRVEGDTVYVGNMKINNGRVEMPNRVIQQNDLGPEPNDFKMPPIPPPNLQHMTPEQRRRVLRALRRNGVVIVRPTPQSTPEN